jgi:hypothetical protein
MVSSSITMKPLMVHTTLLVYKSSIVRHFLTVYMLKCTRVRVRANMPAGWQNLVMRQALNWDVAQRRKIAELVGVVYIVWSKLLIVSTPIQILQVGL